MRSRITPIVLATAILSVALLPVLAAPAQASLVSDIVGGASQSCPPEIVPFVLCTLQPIKDEVDFQVAFHQALAQHAVNYVGGAKDYVVFQTTVYTGQQTAVTVALVDAESAHTFALVAYVNGVPTLVGTYAGDVANGECAFWLSGGPCFNPGPVLNGEQGTPRPVPVISPPDSCDPSGGMVPYLICVAEVVALNTAAHYGDVADGADAFVTGTSDATVLAAQTFADGTQQAEGAFASGTQAATTAYEGAMGHAADGAGAEANYLVFAECNNVLGQGSCETVTL